MKVFDNTMPRTRKVLLYIYASVMAYRTYKEARSLWADLKADRAEKKTFEDFAPQKPSDTIAGVHLSDLKYKAWNDLDPSDYHDGDALRGWTPKPNPYALGTDAYDDWAAKQDATSF